MMSKTIIKVEHLTKTFAIKHQQEAGYKMFSEVLKGSVKSIFQPRKTNSRTEDFHALDDVSFEIKEGERVGVIGRNGAGKSTLLKVLSRITPPTKGKITIHGRMTSLLEVGTGFHPELSGRENIYLNGAILGMTRPEITSKFDEIVAFSEIERFLDTPVKRYSSGMYVRLAFSVAAHLEPEILIVDEVLAVGDAAFQKKCLGKMQEISGSGRTILFVSHNIAAVQNLCNKAIYLQSGRLIDFGDTAPVLRRYIQSSSAQSDFDLSKRTDRSGNGALRFTHYALLDAQHTESDYALGGEEVHILLGLQCLNPKGLSNVRMSLGIDDEHGIRATILSNELTNQLFDEMPTGAQTVTVTIPRLPLKSGEYKITLFAEANGDVADWLPEAFVLRVESGDFFRSGKLPQESQGTFYIDHSFQLNT
jgi:lipopolysaccharide transport system ATP-binding protein